MRRSGARISKVKYGMDKAHEEYSEKGFRKRQNANTKGAANRAAQKGTCEIVTDLYNY